MSVEMWMMRLLQGTMREKFMIRQVVMRQCLKQEQKQQQKHSSP